jgi:hypothetical protein
VTRVQIFVDTSLGDMQLTRDDQLGGRNDPQERGALADLLSAAIVQTCHAYQIEPVAVTSRIEEARRLRDPLLTGAVHRGDSHAFTPAGEPGSVHSDICLCGRPRHSTHHDPMAPPIPDGADDARG